MEYVENTPLIRHPLENLDLDRLLSERLGEWGVYQKVVYLLVCLPAALTAGITLASVFTADIPSHRCWVGYYITIPWLLYYHGYYITILTSISLIILVTGCWV